MHAKPLCKCCTIMVVPMAAGPDMVMRWRDAHRAVSLALCCCLDDSVGEVDFWMGVLWWCPDRSVGSLYVEELGGPGKSRREGHELVRGCCCPVGLCQEYSWIEGRRYARRAIIPLCGEILKAQDPCGYRLLRNSCFAQSCRSRTGKHQSMQSPPQQGRQATAG